MSPLKTILQLLVSIVIIVAAVRLIAGRWDLPMVWVYLGTYLVFLFGAWWFVFRKDPDLRKERRQSGANAERWDRVWLRIYTIFLLITLIVALLDVGRLHWSDTVSLWLQVASLLVGMAAMIFSGWAMHENTFFSEVVRIQDDRGHRVVTSGPYRWVRHPGYLGNIVTILCTALVFGSWLALIPAGIVVVLFFVRTALEDQTLQDKLDGYAEYAQTVRYRLVPGVW